MIMRFSVPTLLLLFLIKPGAVLLAADITLWDVAGKAEISLHQAAGKFPSPGIVYVGEFHDNAAHHAAQLAVIQSLDKRQRPLAVGLEMFQHIEQSILDVWVAKALSEEEMRRAFARNWGQDWHLYRDIFLYCRDRSIPMVGLNVPRSITRKVARNGFESLTPEEIGKLPPIVCRVDREYEEFLRRVLGSHGSDSGFRRFCEAQLVWDTAMAIYALEYLKSHPERTVVVLCGMIHAWKKAAPEQAARENAKVEQTVIQPSVKGRWTPESVSKEDADYLILGLEE
ncbi:MAG: ChaN family lipoprotein [Desulfosarcina sp.]